jgi:hypothetical protein
MRDPMRPSSRLAALAAALALSSCTGTKMVQVWREPTYETQPVKRAFIVCIMPNDRVRVVVENTLAKALLERGILAATSTGVFEYAELDKEKATAWVRENKIDLVIVQRMVKHMELSYMPGTLDAVPPAAYYGGWWPTYGTGDGFWYTSSYVEEDTSVQTETTVFSAHTDPEKLVWRGASNTFNIQSATSGAKSLQTELVADLVKAGILPK